MNSNDLLKIQGDMAQAQTAPGNVPAAGGGVKLDPMELVRLICRSWYWFVGMLAVALIIAWVKLKSAEPVYTRTASVLIKDKSTGTRLGGEAQAFQEVAVLGSNASLENEMLMFKTERLNREVVQRLGLETAYLEDVGLRHEDLYGRTPVTVEFREEKTKPGVFTLKFLDNGRVSLTGFSGAETAVETELNKAVKTPLGWLTVKPTLLYGAAWKGRTLKVVCREVDALAKNFSARIVTSLANKGASVVNLTLNDVSAQRAEDYLNTLVEVYRGYHQRQEPDGTEHRPLYQRAIGGAGAGSGGRGWCHRFVQTAEQADRSGFGSRTGHRKYQPVAAGGLRTGEPVAAGGVYPRLPDRSGQDEGTDSFEHRSGGCEYREPDWRV